MPIEDLQKAFDLIEASDAAYFAGAKDEALITLAEKALGVTFPPSYRAFLSRFGCGNVGGFEVYGVVDGNFEDSEVPDGIWLTLAERKAGLPAHLVIVSETGYGPQLCIDVSRTDTDLENPVVMVGVGGDMEDIYRDFGEFLLREIELEL